MSTQPRVHIVSDSRFYVDGGTWDPALYDMEGSVVDGFYNNTALAPTVVDPSTYKGRQNGVVEFKLNDKYYLFAAYTSQSATEKPCQFALFEFKDSNKNFSEMTLLYRFPDAGMGIFSDGASLYATIPQVEIISNGIQDKARLFIYSWKNGYGIYDFIPKDIETSNAKNTIEKVNYRLNNRVIELNESAVLLSLYNASGQKVQEINNTNAIVVPASGIFVLKAKFANSETQTIKVVVP